VSGQSPKGTEMTVLADCKLEIGRLRPEDIREVARMHYEFFGGKSGRGRSIARLGPEFLECVFYGLNQDNRYFFVDVARWEGRIVGFSVYSSSDEQVFRETIRRHWGAVAFRMFGLFLRRPWTVLEYVLGNRKSLTAPTPASVRGVHGWYFLLGVLPECRGRQFKKQTGIWLADEFWSRMETSLVREGCEAFWGVVARDNEPMNRLFQRNGAQMVADGLAQNVPSIFYLKSLRPGGGHGG